MVNQQSILTTKAVGESCAKRINAGLLVIAVNASGTSQDCSSCGVKVPKKLQPRWQECQCGCSLDRDQNAAINIKNRALGNRVLKAQSISVSEAGARRRATAIAGFALEPTPYCTQSV